MVFVIPERRHKVGVSELVVGSRIFDFCIRGNSCYLAPVGIIVCGYSVPIVGEIEIDFKDAMTELIVEQKSFIRVSVGIPEYATEGMGDIGIVFYPVIVEIIGWLRARDIDYFGSDVPIRRFIDNCNSAAGYS